MIELIYLLTTTHITIICVTLFLHRGQAHKGIVFNPVVSHFMRFWLWLTTGMITKQWVAIHRKHHSATDTADDPHSPHVHGIWNIVLRGVYYYYKEGKNARMILSFGKGTPDDWMERNIYSKYSSHGITILLIINTLLFNGYGILIWLIQMAWIPFWAAGVVNGIGHYWGYRNNRTNDHSRNIIPFGFIIGGEELHNNHHNNPASVKLSEKWWEVDIGYVYLKILMLFRLAHLR